MAKPVKPRARAPTPKNAAKAMLVGAPDSTPLPLGKSRAARFDEAFGDPADPYSRRLGNLALNAHPDAAVKDRIEAALQALHLNPNVHRESRELTRFVFLMRELLTDFLPGMTLEGMLEPLHTVLARMAGATGGKSSRGAEQAKNRESVRKALNRLPFNITGRSTTSWLVKETKLDANTVRDHLKAIRGETKT